jgi:mono/diheme cytochrome c family protein
VRLAASRVGEWRPSRLPFAIRLMALCLLVVRPASAAEPHGPLDVDPEALRPGLTATYRSLGAGGESLQRVDPKPTFSMGASSPHPRIPPGPFEAVWTGILLVQDPGTIAFSAFLGGEVTMDVDGVTVLRGVGRSQTSRLGPSETLTRRPGHYRVTIRYRSLADVPARLQIGWEGPSFAREPLPAWRFSHLAEERTPALAREQAISSGRDAAGRFGCARCHRGGLPAVDDPPPGPSLADARRRLGRDWLLRWLEEPAKVKSGARMPALFRQDRSGFVERWVLAEFLGGRTAEHHGENETGKHRAGRLAFLSLGCAACHFVPDQERAGQPDLGRVELDGLGDRMSAKDLAAFLGNPHVRYPDGRMPRLPVGPDAARDIAAYLLLWSKPSTSPAAGGAPTEPEIRELGRRLGVSARSTDGLATALIKERGCNVCHSGLGATTPRDIPLPPGGRRGCLTGQGAGVPRFTMGDPTREALTAYLQVALREVHSSPFTARQRHLARAGCVRCHQRDSDGPPPIEEVGRTLGGAFLQMIPYQRTPRLSFPHQKLTRTYLVDAVREGVAGLRSDLYTYRMPAFGPEAESLVQALAESDGELEGQHDPESKAAADPTVGTLTGPELVGSQGYGCISCHVWNGQQFSQPDPGAIGPDLTRMVGRVRRDWFDRFLENPTRFNPGTPMPGIFPHGQKASLRSVLDGDPTRQKEAMWSYFGLGSRAPAPRPPPPIPIAGPAPHEPPLVAQIPIRLPDGGVVEALCLLNATHDLVIYDLAAGRPRAAFTGGRILRNVQGRTRQFLADGAPVGGKFAVEPPVEVTVQGRREVPVSRNLLGYDRLAEGARLRSEIRFPAGAVELEETLRIVRDDRGGRLEREVHLAGIPKGASAVVRPPERYEMPPARPASAWEGKPRDNPDPEPGSLERPGYRAVAFPRPKLISGEDRVMPVALAVHPRDGHLFVSSLKTGELFVVKEPRGDLRDASFEDYAHGLFQDAYSMLAEDDALYILHRRNLTRILATNADGTAGRFERVAELPQSIADAYDYAYGLVRDRTGGFLLSYAPYANTSMPGSGGILRLVPGKAAREIAFGLRNPLGWCIGPGGEAFFTDNQGEWVAANKLCHVDEGRFYGFPNPAQKQHVGRTAARPVVWVPYGWAHSINGVAYDRTGGKFGPFEGQFFLAELMFGGAIVRANVERINGQYQGACFPFWGKGLLGPVSLAFDPKGHLYVGGITEPGWMAQPDRGALFRIDFTGRIPFEIQSIHVLPRGFRVVYTRPVTRPSASDPASYRVERYRYEYTGAYGSPELERTGVNVARVSLSEDGRSAELTTSPLVKDRVYLISIPGVRSMDDQALVHPTGAYTLNEIPGPPDG